MNKKSIPQLKNKGRSVNEDLRFANLIKKQRILTGVSQKDIAAILNVSVQQVQKYESGRNRVTVNVLAALCPLLKISMDEFLANSVYESKALILQDVPEKEITKIISKYRYMPQEKREYVIKFINSIAA